MRYISLISLITMGAICVNAYPFVVPSEETDRISDCLATFESITSEYAQILTFLELSERVVDSLDSMELMTDSVNDKIENLIKDVCCNPKNTNYSEDGVLDIANSVNEANMPLQDIFDLLSFKKDEFEASGSDNVERVKKVVKKLVAGEAETQMCVRSKFPEGYNIQTYENSIHVDVAELEKVFDGYYP